MEKEKFLQLIDMLEGKTDKEMKELYADAFCSAMKNKDFNKYTAAKVLMHAACLVKSLKNAERDFNLDLVFADVFLKQLQKDTAEKKVLPFPFPFNKNKRSLMSL